MIKKTLIFKNEAHFKRFMDARVSRVKDAEFEYANALRQDAALMDGALNKFRQEVGKMFNMPPCAERVDSLVRKAISIYKNAKSTSDIRQGMRVLYDVDDAIVACMKGLDGKAKQAAQKLRQVCESATDDYL